MTTRKDRLKGTLLGIVKETTGRTKLLAFLLKELDSPRCVGEQKVRYQRAFDKLTGADYESVKFTGGPTFASVGKQTVEPEEIDPFA